MGLHRHETFAGFRDRVANTGLGVDDAVASLQGGGQANVVGYGATSKSTTTINFFGITPDLVEFLSDTTPAKQGTFSPGAHLPVRPHEDFAARYPDRALLFLWNHAAEVMHKEQAFGAAAASGLSTSLASKNADCAPRVRNLRTGMNACTASLAAPGPELRTVHEIVRQPR